MTAGLILSAVMATAAKTPHPQDDDPLTGVRVGLPASWTGRATASESMEILVLAGHADSQGIEGAGTSGAAVDRGGARPMDARMRDELFWNRRVRDAVVKTGQARGLKIRSYEPDQLTIANEEDPRTNWSVGRRHHDAGGYALEIHFDAYGRHGVGSGLIPNLRSPATRIDESLALNFGLYPELPRRSWRTQTRHQHSRDRQTGGTAGAGFAGSAESQCSGCRAGPSHR